ncbi:hypothetical protein AMS68_005967 [Peltaster fructicola]|uniref:SCP domain-containing protein n=1 Tax=Peltaster fructicola TaxID=286661 RepID=A0A6H0Y1C0_9PEZI|nr:hypothetical protein AMS68_005967 [Peltaster fructicola]
MKSTIAFALAATIPFAMASPYHMIQHAARDADANDMVVVTDVDVVAVTTQVTVYYTGEPATTSTSAIASPTVAAVQQKQQHEEHQHSRQSSVVWTIQKTTTSEVAPTTTSTVAPPVAEPTTIITIVATSSPAPSPQPATSSTSSQEAPVVTSVAAATVNTPTYTRLQDPADYASDPAAPAYGVPTTGSQALQGSNFQTGMVMTHNAWRAKWNASSLTWDDNQASQAQALAQSCPTATPDNPDSVHNRACQNIAWGSSIDTAFPIHQWGAEADQYQKNEETLNLPSGPITQYRMGGAGHFTQLVWKGATVVGCGTHNCGDDENQWWITVCNYDTGNVYDPAMIDDWDQYGRNGSYAMNVNWAPLW